MSLDIIGKIYDISGDPENPTVTELDGWHVNSTGPLESLDDYRVEPTLPRRVFAGVDTYYYRFDDDAQANGLLGLNDELE